MQMHETFWFRFTVAALVLVGAAILVVSLHGRHEVPRDDGTLPRIPTAEDPANR